MKTKLKLLVGVLASMHGAGAMAVTFDVYNDINPAGYIGDGSELAAALVTTGGGITIVNGSEEFQGNFDNSTAVGDAFDGDPALICGDDPNCLAEFVDIPPPSPDTDYGSAAIYTDLNFGSIDDTDFVLPDGILLTSGNANLPEMNTDSGFTGLASGVGDAGLQALLDTLPGGHISTDATVLTFDFTVDAGVNAVSLDFIFGTDEYSEFVDSYPEIAAVFVDGVNYAGFSDGSLLTLTGATVGSGNFYNNDIWDGGAPTDPITGASPLAIEYDGVSAPLTLVGLLDETQTVHSIKIAVSDSNDTILDTGLFVANMQGLTVTGATDPSDPLLPLDDPNDPTPDSFDFVIDVGDTGVGIDPSFPIFVDPYVATGYTYAAFGANFATVVIPFAYGDGLYNVYVWDDATMTYVFVGEIGVNDQFDFLALDPAGYDKFMIDGIEISAAIDPADPLGFVTGLTFTNSGMITVTQTAIQTCDGSPDCSNNVPEPNIILLLGGGLIGLGYLRRRQKRLS